MKAVDILLNSILPEDLRGDRTWDKKSIDQLMADIANKHPARYAELAKKISDVGRNAAYRQGETLTLSDMRGPIDKAKVFDQMDREIEMAKATTQGEAFESARMKIYGKYAGELEKQTIAAAIAGKNNLANTVISGARGSTVQLRGMITTPALYTDYKGRTIPRFVRHSFGEGVRPADYLAGAFGVRLAVMCLHEDTEVRMADGSSRSIKSINPGDWVMGADITGVTFPVRVTERFFQGKLPVNRYRFENSDHNYRELVCTENHKILLNSNAEYRKHTSRRRRDSSYVAPANAYHMVKVDKIGCGEPELSAVLPCGNSSTLGRMEPMALLFGLLTGDGCLTHGGRITLSCADEGLVSDVRENLSSLGLELKKYASSVGKNWDYSLVKSNYSARQNKSIQPGIKGFVGGAVDAHRRRISEEGLWDKYSYEKEVPKTIGEWDNTSVAEYLAGLYATDGSVVHGKTAGAPSLLVSYASTSLKLIEKVKWLLEFRFGVYGSRISTRTKGGFGTSDQPRLHPLYTFGISSYHALSKFKPVANLIPGKKRDKFLKLLSEFVIKQSNPYPKARLEDVTKVPDAYCYDIEVDHPDHLFVLSCGLIVSNSTKNATADAGDLCLHEDTLVRMADGTGKSIKHIVPGDLVVGSDKHGMTFPVKVVAKFDQGYKHVERYGFLKSGNSKVWDEVVCTDNHKFLIHTQHRTLKRDILPLGKLSIRSKAVPVQGFKDEALKDEDFALLIGLLVGDGYVPDRRDSKINLTCADPSLIEDIVDYAKSLGVKLHQRNTQKIQYTVTCPGAQVGGSPLKAKLREVGVLGKKAHTKTLPTGIYSWSNKSVAAFLGGYFSADGSVTQRITDGNTYPEISISSVSKPLIEGVLDLLKFRFGITGSEIFETSESDRRASGTFNSNGPGYMFVIGSSRDVTKFRRLIPLVGRKAKSLSVCQEAKGVNISKGFRPVVHIGDAGTARCFDIEVDHPEHLFVLASGIICSNSKQLVQSTSNLLVTEDDCGVANGISTSIDDRDTVGRVLARDVGKFKAGMVIDRHVANDLRASGVKNIIARSALTCQAQQGICSHCLGQQAGGKFAPIGFAAGITAAQAIAEPLTQGALNTKHEAGAFKGERRTFAGFDVINQLMQSPETFPHRAAISELEGRVDDIADAPQGGKFITVGGQKHYALPGYEPIVKKGDTVETGDQLSDGIMDVNDVVRLRGLGEGRRYYVDRVQQALSDSGAGNASRRNLELIARGALDHVRVTSDDGVGSYLPDDLGSYNHLAVTYSPPAHVKNVPLKTARGLYLHAPALHYSIGTKLSGRMVKEMQDSGVTDVTAHEDAPPFVPEMVRLRGSQYAGTDWLAKHHASNISRNIGLDAERARDTNVEKNVHFVPRLAVGMGFGDKVNESGEF